MYTDMYSILINKLECTVSLHFSKQFLVTNKMSEWKLWDHKWFTDFSRFLNLWAFSLDGAKPKILAGNITGHGIILRYHRHRIGLVDCPSCRFCQAEASYHLSLPGSGGKEESIHWISRLRTSACSSLFGSASLCKVRVMERRQGITHAPSILLYSKQ